MGIGNFFGRLPSELRENSKLYGVEKDSLSGRIAQKLYPQADITIDGFENTHFQDNSFDVAIGNIPFGDFGVIDKKYSSQNLKIHDYFFVKSLDKVRDGGVVAFVTSKGTLDKKDSSFRRALAEKADLVGLSDCRIMLLNQQERKLLPILSFSKSVLYHLKISHLG